jgi:hypothetical protein
MGYYDREGNLLPYGEKLRIVNGGTVILPPAVLDVLSATDKIHSTTSAPLGKPMRLKLGRIEE